MSASFNNQRINKASGGFSLVEVLVGMVIGLLGMLIMMQMLSFSENQRRTTAGSSDAQNTGAIALYGIERDIQQSGYGIDAQVVIGCNVSWTASGDGKTVTLPLAPVIINPATVNLPTDANSDIVVVTYGSSSSPEEGDVINAQASQDVYTVGTQSLYNVNDHVIAQYALRQHPCPLSMTQIASINGSSASVNAGTGIAGITTTNKAASAYPTLYNLGATPTVRAYAVNNGNLTVCDYTAYNCAKYAGTDTTHWVPVAANIVSLKAQYGRDANAGNMNAIVDTYDKTTPPADTSATVYAPIISCQWARISGVRIALVAQGAYSSATVNTTAPTWDGSATDPIDLSAADPGWANYHLKVFQTAVPIRNIIMQGVVSGC